jgi:hypothetical protein
MPSPEQLRVSAILAFREELARLEGSAVLALDPAAKDRLRAHHDAELARLAAQGDVDLTQAAARLSTGMRIATLLGTAALSAAYALFVNSRWGTLSTALQLSLVIIPTLVLVTLTHVAAQKERSGYIASLFATVAAIAFLTNLSVLGWLYNLPDSRMAFLVVGLFALILAYGYGLILPLVVGIVSMGIWGWTLGAIPLGLWWRQGFAVIETLLLTGVVVLMVPALMRGPAKFAPWWRGIGAGLLVLGLLLVGESGNFSGFTSVSVRTIAHAYQVVSAVALATMMVWGIRQDQRVVTLVGTVGAVLFLYLRLVDWFWKLVPQWLFFLMVGGLALAVLLVLRRLRRVGVAAT